MYVFRTIEEYILTFGRVRRQPRIISRSGRYTGPAQSDRHSLKSSCAVHTLYIWTYSKKFRCTLCPKVWLYVGHIIKLFFGIYNYAECFLGPFLYLHMHWRKNNWMQSNVLCTIRQLKGTLAPQTIFLHVKEGCSLSIVTWFCSPLAQK